MGQQDWNLLGKHIFKPNAPIDARELVNSDSDIVNIDSAYIGMIVTVNSDPIKRYKIKKITWEGHPDSLENGGYELIQEPKDLKYSDGMTPFLNNNGNINADYLKFADIDGSEEKSIEDDFNVKTDTLHIDGTTYENSKELSIRILIDAADNNSVTINVYHANALTISALNPDNTAATWLTVPDNIEVGTNTLTISAAENTETNPRGAKVIISDGTDVVIVNVVQNYSTNI